MRSHRVDNKLFGPAPVAGCNPCPPRLAVQPAAPRSADKRDPPASGTPKAQPPGGLGGVDRPQDGEANRDRTGDLLLAKYPLSPRRLALKGADLQDIRVAPLVSKIDADARGSPAIIVVSGISGDKCLNEIRLNCVARNLGRVPANIGLSSLLIVEAGAAALVNEALALVQARGVSATPDGPSEAGKPVTRHSPRRDARDSR